MPSNTSAIASIRRAARSGVVALAIVLGPMADYGSIVKMDQHVRTPFRMSLITDLAMKRQIGEGLCDHQGWNR